jgi:hypothetical protein
MAEPIDRSVVQVQDWPGLKTNTGPMADADAPGAAVVQVNLRVSTPGEMGVRNGLRKVSFDSE